MTGLRAIFLRLGSVLDYFAGLRATFLRLRPVLDYFAGPRAIFCHLRPVLSFYIGVMSTILSFCGSESYILMSETRFSCFYCPLC